jgi:hypothetical protein
MEKNATRRRRVVWPVAAHNAETHTVRERLARPSPVQLARSEAERGNTPAALNMPAGGPRASHLCPRTLGEGETDERELRDVLVSSFYLSWYGKQGKTGEHGYVPRLPEGWTAADLTVAERERVALALSALDTHPYLVRWHEHARAFVSRDDAATFARSFKRSAHATMWHVAPKMRKVTSHEVAGFFADTYLHRKGAAPGAPAKGDTRRDCGPRKGSAMATVGDASYKAPLHLVCVGVTESRIWY